MHPRHDLIVSYMEYLSEVSDKAQILHYGETYEKRKLVILAKLLSLAPTCISAPACTSGLPSKGALASSNKIIMLENAIYSVISPEGCASILWRDPTKTLEAAKAMKLTSKDLLNLKIIDEIIISLTNSLFI